MRRLGDDYDYRFGIRAHPNMNVAKSFWSILVPWHNEWLVILIYLVFALYFWIETFLIMGRSSIYKLKNNTDWDFMFIGTLGFAISLTATAAFLILYSMSQKWFLFFEMIDFMGKIVLAYFYTFAFIGSELVGTDGYYPMLFILAAFLLASLVLIQYQIGRTIAFWGSLGLLVIYYFYDFVFSATPKQKEVFYIPMFVEFILLGAGYLLFVFSVPERWCKKTRCCQLYFTGYIIFTAILINFLFEAQDILYLTIKLNSGYYDPDEDNWWKTDNIYHKDD